MRIADAEVKLRKIYEKKYHLQLNNFSFQNIASIGSGSLSFTGGVSVICGANGTGKSTILRAIHCGITKAENPDQRFGHPKLNSTLKVGDQAVSIEVDYSQDVNNDTENETLVEMIDPSKSALSLVSFFAEEKNLEEWKESVLPNEFSGKELETISQLVGKKYDILKIYELDDVEGFNESPLPYFEVTTTGRSYSTPTMGLGELVLLYVFWRLYSIDKPSIVLLEEPDTYVSYASQEQLFNILAKFSLEKDLWIILTTHSTAIASKVPLQHMTLINSHLGETVFNQNPTLTQVLRLLGLPEKRDGLFLVEDDEAEEFLRSLLAICEPSILKQFVIINLKDTGQIASFWCKSGTAAH